MYENGVLCPLSPVTLRESQTVQLRVLPQVPEIANEIQRALQPLIDAGVLTAPPRLSDVEISEQTRRERAEKLGKIPGKPLSEIIIEDRGTL